MAETDKEKMQEKPSKVSDLIGTQFFTKNPECSSKNKDII